MQVVSLSLFRFSGWRARIWAFAQMGFARLSMPELTGLEFYKLFGTGTGEGFTPVPNTSVYAILGVWENEEDARAAIRQASIYQRYRRNASEAWTVYMTPTSSRGWWSRKQPFSPGDVPLRPPIAALTRATIKPKILLQFWRQVPAISKVIGNDPNVAIKIGMGEVPWLHQVTFSIWPDLTSMSEFARRDGPHARAIKAVRYGDWFSEELYARFAVLDDHGTWEGQHPLAHLKQLSEPIPRPQPVPEIA